MNVDDWVFTGHMCRSFHGSKWHRVGVDGTEVETLCGTPTTPDWFFGASVGAVQELCARCFPKRPGGYVVVDGRSVA